MPKSAPDFSRKGKGSDYARRMPATRLLWVSTCTPAAAESADQNLAPHLMDSPLGWLARQGILQPDRLDARQL